MHKTTLLTAAGLLLTGPVRILAQTIDPNVGNADLPFTRNIRPDRPGQTVTTSVLRPGQLELGTQSQRSPATGAASPRGCSGGPCPICASM